jgi:hypothetical protein
MNSARDKNAEWWWRKSRMKRAAKKRKEGSTSRTRGEVAAGVEENVCRKAFKVDCGHFPLFSYIPQFFQKF